MRQHALDVAEFRRARQQLLRDVEIGFPADHHVRVREAVEGHVDRAFGAVLDGDDAVLRAAALHFLEDVDDRAGGPVHRRFAETEERRLVRERRGRREERDRHGLLEGAAGGEDLSPHRARHVGGQRAGVPVRDPPEDFRLTLRRVDRGARVPFEVSDLESSLGALVEEVEDLTVEVIDPGTPFVQVHGDSC